MLQFNGLAGLPSYLQRSCYTPKHLGKHSSKRTKLKMLIFLRLNINAHRKQSFFVFQWIALLVRKPTKWLRLFFVPKHLVILITVYQANTGH